MDYQVLHLRDNARPGANQLIETLKEQNPPNTFGIFAGLFGLQSNEVYLVTYGEPFKDVPPDIERLNSVTLTPTARPTEHKPREKTGIYVFRWFKVDPANVEEIVALSEEAWKTFEGGFDTEVQALFTTEDRDTMLLITWYKDLSVWEASRFPAEEARENFLKRHQLTRSAKPIATRLVSVPDVPSLVSHS